MMESVVLCPSCGSTDTRSLGTIPCSDTFVGDNRRAFHANTRLFECHLCGLAFRHPQESAAEILDAYSSADDHSWRHSIEERPDWKLARSLVKLHASESTSVLDVGCYRGDFLACLDLPGRVYGVEPNRLAAERARSVGVDVIASDIGQLERKDILFDWITAFDVLEHLSSPRAFVEMSAGLLKPGGRLVIATGYRSHWTFRLMEPRYYYCTLAEHVSFINQKWIGRVASEFDLKVELTRQYSHYRASWGERLTQCLKNGVYSLSPEMGALARRCGFGGKDVRSNPGLLMHPPQWMPARDHIMVVFRRGGDADHGE
ncbi:MAG: class I SAM-dependent methyltransferase [Terrimicrobiaceae bacterium]|nr:class I SAM-dependent methyltransferase [Terrimicrobiaceae bacterium]